MCGMMPSGAVTAQLLNTVVMCGRLPLAVWLMWLAGGADRCCLFSLRPALRRNWKWYLAAWALSRLPQSCALLYFGVYPGILTASLPALARHDGTGGDL